MTLNIAADEHISYLNYYFSGQADITLFAGRSVSAREVKDADVLLVRSVTQVNEDLLSDSRVRFVGSVTAGSDHLDMEFLEKKGIAVRLAHGFNAQSVADYTLSVLLLLHKEQRILFNKNTTIAVMGVGAVGSRVERYLRVLGVNVVLYDPPRAESEAEFQSCSWADVLNADVICVHVPWSREGSYPTDGCLNQVVFQQLKAGTIIINAARGEVLREDDFLHFGHHLLLCSDVWTNEPHCNLQFMERTHIASPHLAGYSWQSKSRGLHLIYHALCNAGFALAPRKMALSPVDAPVVKAANWVDALLSVFDPSRLSDEFKLACLTSEKPHCVFDDWRRNHFLRHELAFSKFDTRELSAEDCRQLRALGCALIDVQF